MRGRIIAASAAAVLMAPSVMAQGKPADEQEVAIPVSAMPPEGMCRLWLLDVPERQQPAPTDCATALRTRPRNAKLLFGNLSEEAKQPPATRLMSPATVSSRALFDDPTAHRWALQIVDSRVQIGTMTPTQAIRTTAAQAVQGAVVGAAQGSAAAAKATPTKAAIKPPDERP
ncbi:MAG: hypothetical protein O2973_00485 [Gemmatimonadetes bacterium]|nr:hypothetical protein [Gemmatimonadota bacterium]